MARTRIDVAGHSLWLDGNGVLHVEAAEARAIGIEVAKLLVAALRQIAGGERRPLLCDLRTLRAMNGEARAYFADSATHSWSKAALVVDTPLTHATASFFMGLDPAGVPTRMFCFARDAEAWLQLPSF